jgi:hypothetical protein
VRSVRDAIAASRRDVVARRTGFPPTGVVGNPDVVEYPMKRTLPLLLALVAVVSCDDEPAKEAAVPTAPVAAPISASASAAAADVSGGSTICRVYATERDVAKTELDAVPTDTLLQRRVKTLDALVNETCN